MNDKVKGGQIYPLIHYSLSLIHLLSIGKHILSMTSCSTCFPIAIFLLSSYIKTNSMSGLVRDSVVKGSLFFHIPHHLFTYYFFRNALVPGICSSYHHCSAFPKRLPKFVCPNCFLINHLFSSVQFELHENRQLILIYYFIYHIMFCIR